MTVSDGCDHHLCFYEREDELLSDLTRFVTEGWAADDNVIVLATDQHMRALDDHLGHRETARSVASRPAARPVGPRQRTADEVLSRVMIRDGWEQSRLVSAVRQVLGRVTGNGRPIRMFTEMSPVLGRVGNLRAALELEAMWNELAHEHSLSLLCAYPMPVIAGADDLPAISQLCRRHSAVATPGRYSAPSSGGGGRRSRPSGDEVFVPVPAAVRAARHFVSQKLLTSGDDDLIDEACLVASELASNAVRHVGSPFMVSVQSSAETVRVAVRDVSRERPRRITPSQVGGRGLMIVERLSSRWGTDMRPDGKVVWSERDKDRASAGEPRAAASSASSW